jgi:hypothetical protein
LLRHCTLVFSYCYLPNSLSIFLHKKFKKMCNKKEFFLFFGFFCSFSFLLFRRFLIF